ncbi:hypothetical protein RclHR1_02160013 [Rhizophagus clarus]|uniref:Proteophosphoglycan 5 n=1 Tax=Rhizophagus clarus TaxID=94130 RepID=A0A2Z6QT77_9GLOM|nr:hypothetical protein RclHR1_02160013 [Rhizophagus clarus]GES82094.1 hypothetical protein GLOIN_2v1470381 [Rhizophagus clarus]
MLKKYRPDFSLTWTRKIILFFIISYIIWIIPFLIFDTDTEQPLSLERITLKKIDNEIDPSLKNITLTTLTNIEDSDSTHSKIIDYDEKINLKYCGEKTCNFIFPYEIPEQETRANVHLRSFTYLAESLNRIMVLPNVGHSRINCCNKFPFEFYYDLEKTREMFPKVKFMTQETFKNWTNELLIKPNTLHTWLIEDGRKDSYPKRNHKHIAIDPGDHYNEIQLNHLCLNQFNLNISDYIEFHSGKKFVKDFEHKMFDFLTKNLKDKKFSVILIRHRCRKQMFPYIEEQIPFAPHILNQAFEIQNKLEPYYCIHWRMEQGIPEKMPSCAIELIKLINNLKKNQGINNIYLATDYPISGKRAASDTFHKVEKYHELAFQMLNSTFDLNTWISLNAFEKFRNNRYYDVEFKSSGIHGILDKLICIQSNYFISGSKDCCRIRSTYTRLIEKSRIKLLEDGDMRLRNTLRRWKNPT